MKNEKPIVVNGIKYRSIAEACRELKLYDCTIRSRLSAGKTLDEAFNMEIIPRNKPIVVNGVKYRSISEACRELNLCSQTIRNRLRAGKTLDEAFISEIFRKRNKESNEQNM